MSIVDAADIGRLDDLGRMDTPLHRLDPRAKALSTLVFIGVVVSFPRYAVSALLPLSFYPLSLIAIGGLPAGYLLRKVALASPFALLVGVFNPVLDRDPVVEIWGVGVSGGWLSFASIVIRFGLTASAALALLSATGIHRLAAGLERLGLPRVFAVQILFLYRYLFVIADEARTMTRAVELRSSPRRSVRLRVYASLVGHLLLRSMDRAERVHRAMAARGFVGEVRAIRPGAWRVPETVFVTAWIAFFAAARTWNLSDALGMWLVGGAR